MPMYKQVNGERIQLTPEEEAERQAEWDAFEAQKPAIQAQERLAELDKHLRRAEEELIDAGGLQVSQFLMGVKAEKEMLRSKLK